jgi:SAM-dependent methyltransferase
LAESVGGAGKVIGVDVSMPILTEARARLGKYPNVETVLADAAGYDFPPAQFDLLFSRFGVMFFGDPVAAFTNLRAAMKPTGRLVFACWRSPKENGWMSAPMQAAVEHLPPSPPPDPEQPGPFAFHSRERVTRILTRAGFETPTFDKIDKMIDVAAGGGLDAAVQSAMELGPTARALDGAGDDLKAVIARALRGFFAPIVKDGAVNLPAAVWIVSAQVA